MRRFAITAWAIPAWAIVVQLIVPWSSAAAPAAAASTADAPLSEAGFRSAMGFEPGLRITYRNVECRLVGFDEFAAQMRVEGSRSDMHRAPRGDEATLTVRRRAAPACGSPYPPLAEMPAFELRDLAGKRMTSASLRGRPTLINFFFAQCVPCIREVEPLNVFATEYDHVNFLAVTFDDRATARRFVERYGFRWRVLPEAQEFIDRVHVKSYPLFALFDAQGRLLGTRAGGAKDELEAANVRPALRRWMEGLLTRAQP